MVADAKKYFRISGKALRIWRIARGMNQDKLANAAGMSSSRVRGIEAAESTQIFIDTANAFAVALGSSFDDFLARVGFSDSPPSPPELLTDPHAGPPTPPVQSSEIPPLPASHRADAVQRARKCKEQQSTHE